MLLNISCDLDYRLNSPSDVILQVEASATPEQKIVSARIDISPTQHFARVPAEEGIGERILMRIADRMACSYRAQVEVSRDDVKISGLPATPVHRLPGKAVRYLMASRYCPSHEFQSFVGSEFGDLTGGALIFEMCGWIGKHFAYVPGSSNAGTTALDTFVQRRGICRDYAHVLIALARAGSIPARMASVYAPNVQPQDFHAVAEIYLDGGWHLVDPTGMATASSMACIGVGSDAADVAFLTVYGQSELFVQSVKVSRAE